VFLTEARPEDKAIASDAIALHTEEFLAAGGVIEYVPFLYTAIPSNPTVAMYRRIYNHGYRLKILGFSDANSDVFVDGIEDESGDE
jgi:hypothetical protein